MGNGARRRPRGEGKNESEQNHGEPVEAELVGRATKRRPSDEAVTAAGQSDGSRTIPHMDLAEIREKVAQLQEQADKSDQKLSEIDDSADDVARRAEDVKAALATITRR